MRQEAVSWKVVGAVAAVVLLALAAVGILRAEGFSAVDATAPYSTRWFTDASTGRIVLIDGYSGKALARLQPSDDTRIDDVVQGGGRAAAIDRSSQSLRVIDGTELKLGPGTELPLLEGAGTVVAMSASGLVAIDPVSDEARIVPEGGTPISLDVPAEPSPTRTRVAPDGGIWTLNGGELRRTTPSGSDIYATGLEAASFTLVGDQPLVLDRAQRRVRFGDFDWVPLPEDVQVEDLVLQHPGPRSRCGWVGVDEQLMCIGEDGMAEQVSIDGLDIDGGDVLAMVGDAGAVVDRSTGSIIRLSWTDAEVLEVVQTAGEVSSNLRVSTGPDLVWVDSPSAPTVWAVNPWGMTTVRKDDASTPILGDEGEVIAEGEGTGSGGDPAPALAGEVGTEDRKPDDNGVDDPPIAVDDVVSARSGTTVPINVTANDYDPDGEAIALASVTSPSNGTATVASATTVSYQPSAGYTGSDSFSYTIVDGDGTEATATVTVELLSPSATNQAPVGTADFAQTGPTRPVVIDVLINDVDPERDALRIGSFQSDVAAGEVEEIAGPSGLPALRFLPASGFSGDAKFLYTPTDLFGAVGEPVEVTVEVAEPGAANRAPITKPDAVRVRRGEPTEVAVLANDVDPDGDDLTLEVASSLPDAIDVVVDGEDLVITAQAGAASLSPLSYKVTDSKGLEAYGNVLVSVVDDEEPNQPPLANADSATVVAGRTTTIDVLRNDTDPDNDTLTLVSVSEASDGGTPTVDGDLVLYTAGAAGDDEPALDQFSYVITDTAGNEVEGVVSVKIIPQELPEPPVALDDSVNTEKDTPVTVDVLDNDSDPSGQPLSIVGTPGCPSGGKAEVTPDQLVRFTPPTGSAGVYRCSYEVSNTSGLRSLANITISVVNPTLTNRPPLITGEDRAVRVGQTITVDVVSNDVDPDGDDSRLKLVNSTSPSRGIATRDEAAGTITYQAPSQAAVVSISYEVADADGAIASGRLVIRVIEEANVAPIASPDSRSAQLPVSEVVVDVLANDSDPDGDSSELEISGVAVRSGSATASISGRSVRVVPAADFVGTITVEYEITDADGLTAVGLVTVVLDQPPQNRGPIARADTARVVAGESVQVSVGLNDSDPDGDPLTFAITEAPTSAQGEASMSGDVLTFAAAIGQDGPVVIGYSVSDGALTTTSTVTIDVAGCEAANPQANDGFLETGYQAPISIDLNQYAKNGRVVDVTGVINTPVATYTPPPGENGTVEVRFAVVNACGGRDTGRLEIDVNQDPSATPVSINLGRRESKTITVNSLATDDEALQIIVLRNAPTWARIQSEGQQIQLDPVNDLGRFAFVALVRDPGGLQVEVPITVEIQNSAPTAYPADYTTTKTQFEFSPIDTATDPDGDPLRYRQLDLTVTFPNTTIPIARKEGNDDILQVDLTGAEGVGSFQYSVEDDTGATSQTVTVTITTEWGSPVANDVVTTIAQGDTADVAADVSHPQNQPIVIEVPENLPTGLDVVVTGDRLSITVAEALAPDEYSFGYTAIDTGGRTASATFTVVVVQPPQDTEAPSRPTRPSG